MAEQSLSNSWAMAEQLWEAAGKGAPAASDRQAVVKYGRRLHLPGELRRGRRGEFASFGRWGICSFSSCGKLV